MEDIRRLTESVPGLVWLDVGTKGATSCCLPVSNVAEWALLLAGLLQLTTFHGVQHLCTPDPVHAWTLCHYATQMLNTVKAACVPRARIRASCCVCGWAL
ncbi:hypothetical protein B0H10DRAFT_2235432 [Mycena sp. CBHHK59/15]|nr:hypothetical protein B0H10DRAFT_2235432 [Mycena sp. CBHHK59/15]